VSRPKPTGNISQPTYKRTGMPLYGENVLNFLYKLVFGVMIFWGLYYNVYDPAMQFTRQMSYIILFSLLSSIMAIFVSYLLIQLITYWLKRPKKGLFDMNSFPDMGMILYEGWAVFLNALFVASGLLVFLQSYSATWEQFFLMYFIMKLITRVMAYAIATMFGKNILLTMGFCVVFFALLMISIMDLAGEFSIV
jgi:hypothetical protein